MQNPASHVDDHGAAVARALLADSPELRHIQLLWTDLNGILRGKSIQRGELERIYEQGLPLPSSIAALTANGDDTEDTGLLWQIGDMDCLARPLAGTLVPSPWLTTPTAQVLMMFDPVLGEPAASADPRLAAQRVIKLLAEDGYTPVLAVELEFYLLDAEASIPAAPRRGCQSRPPFQNSAPASSRSHSNIAATRCARWTKA